jgi:hypothetical protein
VIRDLGLLRLEHFKHVLELCLLDATLARPLALHIALEGLVEGDIEVLNLLLPLH